MNFPDRCRNATLIDVSESQPLFTRTGHQICTGFTGVEYGGRGPYVEMLSSDICPGAIALTAQRHLYFTEYRTTDEANLMVYYQRQRVSYARYQTGRYYIDLLSTFDANGNPCFDFANGELLKEICRRRAARRT